MSKEIDNHKWEGQMRKSTLHPEYWYCAILPAHDSWTKKIINLAYHICDGMITIILDHHQFCVDLN